MNRPENAGPSTGSMRCIAAVPDYRRCARLGCQMPRDFLGRPAGPGQQNQTLGLGRRAVRLPVRVRGLGGERGDLRWVAGMGHIAAYAVTVDAGAVSDGTSETNHRQVLGCGACLRWFAHCLRAVP
jgi:hypothetical protein